LERNASGDWEQPAGGVVASFKKIKMSPNLRRRAARKGGVWGVSGRGAGPGHEGLGAEKKKGGGRGADRQMGGIRGVSWGIGIQWPGGSKNC